LIGGKLDPDLLSLFLKKYARFIGGMERNQGLKVNSGAQKREKA
jgi:hypothetical protein